MFLSSTQGRIKRIMQADEEVGKIAQAVPVIISRTLELFVESLLTKSSSITSSRNASEFPVRNHRKTSNLNCVCDLCRSRNLISITSQAMYNVGVALRFPQGPCKNGAGYCVGRDDRPCELHRRTPRRGISAINT